MRLKIHLSLKLEIVLQGTSLGQIFFLLCCPLPTDRKMRKTGSFFFFFFFFFMSDLGEEFAKICIQWLKKALVYRRWGDKTL